MKAILEFTDEHELRQALNGGRYESIITEHLRWLRDALKYSELTTDERRGLEEARKQLWDGIQEQGVERDFA
jgi:hypothetical protein